MGGFRDLEGAVDPSVALQPILPEETAFADEELDDDVALGVVLQDAQEALGYLRSKGLVPLGIEKADDLVRAYVKPRQWSDGRPRANMPMFAVLEAIEKILPTLYMALFGSGKKMPFILTPVGKTKPEAARARSSVLWWAMKQAGTVEEMRRTLKTVLTYGFTVGWWGWESKKHRVKVYSKQSDGSVKGEWKEQEVSIPTYECLDLKTILFDPKCKRQDIQKGAGYAIKQVMITANDLDGMRDDPTYKNIPTRDELRMILATKNEPTEDTTGDSKRNTYREFQAELDSKNTSVDPLSQPLEYLERWDGSRVIGVLQRTILIRNEANEFGVIPGVSCAFVDVLGSAWGFGVARLLSGEQYFQTGVANNWIDSLALVLNPVYQLLKGIGAGTQNITVAPGKVVTVPGEIKPLVTPDVSQPAMNAIATSEERAAKRVGADGGTNLPTQALRTGAGVNTLQGDTVQRLQYFLEIFINMVYVPVLEAFQRLCVDKLQPDQLNYILTQEEGKAFEGDIMDVYNATCDVDTLAGVKLTAKMAAGQLAPQIMAWVGAGPVQESLQIQNKKFDYSEFAEETLELLGWDIDSLFVDMTPEDQQRVKEKNQAMSKGIADAQLQQQKHTDDLEDINEKGTVQAGVAMVKQAAKSHMDEAQQALENMNGGE